MNLYAELMDEMPDLHPGCLVASITYQEQMFDPEVRRMNRECVLGLRRRFADWLAECAERHPPAGLVDVNALADQVTVVLEGGIIISKALNDRAILGRQLRLFRDHVKMAFGA